MAQCKYEIDDAGDGSGVQLYRVQPREMVRGADEILKQVWGSQSLQLPSAFAIDLDGAPHKVDLSVSMGQTAVASTRLTKLRLDTTWIIRNNVLMPVFDPAVPDGLQRAMIWHVPAGMKLRFAVQMKLVGGASYHAMLALLWAVNNEPGCWRLPLSNTYEDGRICMGREMERGIFANTIPELFSKALSIFGSSEWNSDLMPDMGRAQGLFRFNPANNEALPADAGWTRWCTRTSHALMAEVPA